MAARTKILGASSGRQPGDVFTQDGWVSAADAPPLAETRPDETGVWGEVEIEGVVYNRWHRAWKSQCPFGDICSGCDARGFCSRAEDRLHKLDPATGRPGDPGASEGTRRPEDPRPQRETT